MTDKMWIYISTEMKLTRYSVSCTVVSVPGTFVFVFISLYSDFISNCEHTTNAMKDLSQAYVRRMLQC